MQFKLCSSYASLLPQEKGVALGVNLERLASYCFAKYLPVFVEHSYYLIPPSFLLALSFSFLVPSIQNMITIRNIQHICNIVILLRPSANCLTYFSSCNLLKQFVCIRSSNYAHTKVAQNSQNWHLPKILNYIQL